MALRTVKPSSPPIKTISIPAATENENGKKQKQKDDENDDFDGSSHFAQLQQQQQQQQQRRRRVSFSDFELLIDCAESPLPRSNVSCLFHTKNKVDTIDKFAHRLSIPDETRENFINEIWLEKTKTNPSLFNGTKFRLSSWEEKQKSSSNDGKEHKTVEIRVGETDYKSFVGTN